MDASLVTNIVTGVIVSLIAALILAACSWLARRVGAGSKMRGVWICVTESGWKRRVDRITLRSVPFSTLFYGSMERESPQGMTPHAWKCFGKVVGEKRVILYYNVRYSSVGAAVLLPTREGFTGAYIHHCIDAGENGDAVSQIQRVPITSVTAYEPEGR